MNARLGWKKLQDRATGLFKRLPQRVAKPSTEAKIRSELGAGVVIAPKRVVRTILHPIKSLRNRAAKTIGDRLLKIKMRVFSKVADGKIEAFEQASILVVPRYVAGVAIGLWGATTAAVISLALSAAVGGQPREWLLYMLIVSGVVGLWNVTTLLYYLRLFRHLEGGTQRRLLKLVASKVGVKGVIIIAVPIAALFALGIARLLLPIP